MPTIAKALIAAAVIVGLLSGCSEKDLKEDMLMIANEDASISDAEKQWSQDNPYGDPTGTHSEKYVVDVFQKYRAISRNVSKTVDIPIKPGTYIGIIKGSKADAYWKNGIPYMGSIVLKINKNGRFEYYEYFRPVGADDSERKLSFVEGRYSVDGFTIKASNVSGHKTVLPPDNVFVVNRFKTNQDRSDFPNLTIDWEGVETSSIEIELLRPNLGLVQMWDAAAHGPRPVGELLMIDLSDEEIKRKAKASNEPILM